MAHIRRIPGFSSQAARTGVCYISGSPAKRLPDGSREDVLDLDVWIDQEGNLEISLDTAREIASLVGYVSEETATTLRDAVMHLSDRNDVLEQLVRDKDKALQVLAQGVVDSVRVKVPA